MVTRWTIGCVVAAVLAAPSGAQDANGGPTDADRQLLADVLDQKARAMASEPPDNDALAGVVDAFQTKLVAWWQRTDEGTVTKWTGPFFNDPEACFHFAEAALHFVPAHPGPHRDYVWPAAVQGSWRCVELNNNHPEGWFLFGQVRAHRYNGHDWAGAMAGYENDLQLNPERLESHQWRAFGYLQLGQPAQAAAAARQGLQHHPNAAKLHELLGDALYGGQDYLGARDAYGTSADLDASNHSLLDKWVNADLLAQQKAGQPPMPTRALDWLRGYDARHPDTWKAGEKRAWIYIEQMWPGVWRGAGAEAAKPHAANGVAQLDALAQRFPDDPRGVYWMQLAARVHRAYAQYDALADAVIEGIRRDPQNADAIDTIMGELANAAGTMNLFDEYRNNEQWESCIALVDRLLAVLPSDTIAENQRRGVLYQVQYECYLPMGQVDEASAAIQAAAAADPSNGVYPNSYGLLLRYQGQPDAALAQFRAALRISEGHEWFTTNMATTLLELGRWDEFFPTMAAALGWSQDRVLAARERQRALVDGSGGDPSELAAAREELEYQQFHAANLRRLYIEGLRLQRAERTK